MQVYQPLDVLPIWGVYLFSLVLLSLSVEAGFRLGRWIEKRWPDRSETGVGTMVGASLAFLGFMLAFVTGFAMNIFNERQHLVISEANAIGTAYLRAGYLEEPISAESRQLLREYLDQRLIALDPAQLEAAMTRSEQIHTELWSRAEISARQNSTPTMALYLSALNEVIDLHTERVNMSLGIRVPPTVLLGVLLVAALTMLLLGMFMSYSGSRNIAAMLIMALILTAVFLIVVDLDRSTQGLIQVPQQALFDLQKQLGK